MGPPPDRVKNPCRICDLNVLDKSGVQCRGACARWAHYKCLGFSPQMILDARDGRLNIDCPCPHCNLKKYDEDLKPYEPCRNDGNCTVRTTTRISKPSMCDDNQVSPDITQCNRNTCFPPCRAIVDTTPTQDSRTPSHASSSSSPREPQRSNQDVRLPPPQKSVQPKNVCTPATPTPTLCTSKKQEVQSTPPQLSKTKVVKEQRPKNVEKQTSGSTLCGSDASCSRREPCDIMAPCGTDKKCLDKSPMPMQMPIYKTKDYKYKLSDARAPTKFGNRSNSSRSSIGRPNQNLVCDTPICREAECSPSGRCYTDENELQIRKRLVNRNICDKNSRLPMVPNLHPRIKKSGSQYSPADPTTNLGEANAPCRNCKCSLGLRLDQFKCVSNLCPTKHPRAEEQGTPKVHSLTACTADKSKSCQCMNLTTGKHDTTFTCKPNLGKSQHTA